MRRNRKLEQLLAEDEKRIQESARRYDEHLAKLRTLDAGELAEYKRKCHEEFVKSRDELWRIFG